MTKLLGRTVGDGRDLEMAIIVKDQEGNLLILSPWTLTYIKGDLKVLSDRALSAFPHLEGQQNKIYED